MGEISENHHQLTEPLNHHQLTEPLIASNTEEESNPHVSKSVVEDLEETKSLRQFFKHAKKENKMLWLLAAPAIITAISQYSLGAVTQIFAGHLTTLELDAVSTENLVIAGLAFGIMMGMGSALETLCGQAFGARKPDMLGVYMQRSWVILTTMCICLLPIYFFATPILRLFREDKDIAVLAGKFALYMIPQLFAYAMNFPIEKFLQAQSKVMVMAVVSVLGLIFHVGFSWLLIVKLKMGLVGAAIALNTSWWLIVLGKFAYIALGYCPGAWNGFSWLAFRDIGAFAKLSIGSAIMLCLEFWFYMFLIIFAGNLADAQVAVAAISVCTNLFGWELMIFLGMNAAISVRVSNELGAMRPRAAKFAIAIVLMNSVSIGLFFFILVLALRDVYGVPFTNDPEVVHTISSLAVLFAFSLLLNSIQPVLSGVAIGAGWQWLVAYINMGCYYLIGIPVGYLLAFPLKRGVQGMWGGMLTGVGLQTIILITITIRTNWRTEAQQADSRVQKWGGMLKNKNEDSTNGDNVA